MLEYAGVEDTHLPLHLLSYELLTSLPGGSCWDRSLTHRSLQG